MKIFSGVFALVMGILMIIVWIIYIASGQHDYQSAPYESSSLLAAEATTAFSLIIGGIAILARKNWGYAIHLASLGMMLYTSIYSIGVFAQTGVIPASIFFSILTIATITLLLMWAFRSLREGQVFHAALGESA